MMARENNSVPSNVLYAKASPISPTQFRMGRAALRYSMQAVAEILGVSQMAISKYESTGDGLGYDKVHAFEIYCQDRGIFFGPKNTISVGGDVLKLERFTVTALYQILKENGVFPTSTEIIDAYDRARGEQ